jgi:hypothetical protein
MKINYAKEPNEAYKNNLKEEILQVLNEIMQGHDLPATLESPRLYGVTPQDDTESEEAVGSLSRWVYEFG